MIEEDDRSLCPQCEKKNASGTAYEYAVQYRDDAGSWIGGDEPEHWVSREEAVAQAEGTLMETRILSRQAGSGYVWLADDPPDHIDGAEEILGSPSDEDDLQGEPALDPCPGREIDDPAERSDGTDGAEDEPTVLDPLAD